jgi:hypothetical protein
MALLARPRTVLPWLLAVALGVAEARAGAQSPSEADVKAVFLYNFAKYVNWPSAPPGSSATIRMCVPANPPFLNTLQAAVRDEVVNGRPLAAIGLEGLDDARACDILYVGDTHTADAAAWLGAVRGRNTLTVGDGRLVDGLVIAFVRDQNRVRFDINRATAVKQRLGISSRLLDLARRVVEP